jgi:phage-related protein
VGVPGGKTVGRVSIRVLPDATRFRNDLKLALKRAESSLSANILVRADTSSADTTLGRFQRNWNGQSVSVGVDASTKLAAAQLRVLTRPRAVTISAQISQASLLKVATAISALSGARVAGDLVKNLTDRLANIDRALPKIAAVSLSVGSLAAVLLNAIGGAGALVLALGRLSGVAGILPAALGASAAGIASLVVAFSGVGGALKAASASTASGASSLKTAESQLALAQRAATDAQRALTQARAEAARQLRDLSNNVVAAQLDQRQSVIDLATAQDEYNAALADPSATVAARTQAEITFQRAQLQAKEQAERLADLRKQQTAASRAGVAGSDAVHQAQTSLLQTQQALSQAQASGVGTANNYGVAMAALAPSARIAVTALLAVRGRLTGIRTAVQQRFFDGFAGSLLRMAAVVLPQLQTGLAGIGGALGGFTQALFSAIQVASSGGALDFFLGNVAAGIAALIPAVRPFIGALSTLGQVGSTFLPLISAGLVDSAERFSAFVSAAAADGSLATWISEGLRGVRELGSVFYGVGRIISGLFAGTAGSGTDALGVLATSLHAIADVIQAPAFQTALSTIFAGASAGATGLATALGPIGAMFAELAPTIQTVLATSGAALGEFLGQIATAISSPVFATGLSAFFAGIITGIQAIAPALPGLASAFGTLMGFAGTLAAQLGPILGTVLSALAPIFIAVLTAVKPLLPILGGALISIIQALAPVFQTLISGVLPPLVDLVSGLIPLITPIVDAILPIISALLPPLVAIISALLPILTPILGVLKPIADLVSAVLVPVLDLLTPVLKVVGDVLSIVAEILAGALTSGLGVVTKLLSGDFSGAVKLIQKTWSDVWTNISGTFEDVWKNIVTFGKTQFNILSSFVFGLLNGLIDMINTLIGGLNLVLDGLKTASGGTISLHIPNLPHLRTPQLASGADILATRGGVLANLGEGGRDERVIDRGLGNRALALTNALAERALAASGAGGRGGHTITITEASSPAATARSVVRLLEHEDI